MIEESGLRIGANGTLKNAKIMILNDIFAAARNIIDFTNELFNEQENEEMQLQQNNDYNNDGNDNNTDNVGDISNEGQQNDEIEQELMDPELNEQDLEDDDEDDEDEDEEEEEFKIIIETRNKQRLVLCTVEGVSCAMLQNPPYFNPNKKQNDSEEDANAGGIIDDEKAD